MSNIEIINGDLLDLDVEVIVNPWNRNLIPFYYLVCQGVSKAIKKRVGIEPFKEVQKHGIVPLGTALITNSGNSKFKNIIHVAGINLLYQSSEYAIRKSVRNAMKVALEHNIKSIGFPIIGSGTGGLDKEKALEYMISELDKINGDIKVVIAKYE